VPTTVDVFEKLAEKIIHPEFRAKWYLIYTANRIKLPPIYFLIDNCIRRKYQFLALTKKQLPVYLEKRIVRGENLQFPILEKIDYFIQDVESVSAESPFDAALFAWGFIERVKFALHSHPAEKSLRDFEMAFRSKLDGVKHGEIIDLLKIPEWVLSEDAPKTRTISLEAAIIPSSAALSSRSKGKIQNELGPEAAPHPLKLKLVEELDTIEGNFLDLDKSRNSLAAKVAELEFSLTPTDLLGEIQISAQGMSHGLEVISAKCASVSLKIQEMTSTALEPLGLSLDLQNLQHAPVSKAQFKNWSLSQKKTISYCLPLIDLSTTITANSKLKEVAENLWTNSSVGFDDIPQLTNNLRGKIKIAEQGLLAMDMLTKLLDQNALNFTWNAFSYPGLTEREWKNLGLLLIQRKSCSIILGICVHMSYRELGNKFARFLEEEISSLEKNRLQEIIKTCRQLTLGQIEGLTTHDENGRLLLSIVELQAYFELATLSHTDAFACWSASPLNGYTGQISSDPFSFFFQSVFALCGTSSSVRVTLADLKVCVIKVRASLTLSDDSNDLLFLKKKLLLILRSYKRGGNTYAELWNRAYATILTPLTEACSIDDMEGVLHAIDKLMDEFDIDDHIDTWKSTISDKLRKRSEYDKHIRAQVNSKINELSAWAEEYRVAAVLKNQSSPTAYEQLERAIRAVYENTDQRCEILKIWFDAVLDEEQGASSYYWCTSSSREPMPNASTSIFATDVRRPRSTLEKEPLLSSYLTDELFFAFGFNRPEDLAEAYVDQKLYEEYFALIAMSEFEVAIDLERRVEAETDEIEEEHRSKIAALELSAKELGKYNEDVIPHLAELDRFLTDRKWAKLDAEIFEVENLILNLRSEIERDSIRERLRIEVQELGGDVSVDVDIPGLTTKKSELLNQLSPRRRHIEPIRLFLPLASTAPDIAGAAQDLIAKLEKINLLPDAEQSTYLAYVLEQPIAPIVSELRRSNTLLPAYRANLKSLTKLLIRHIATENFLLNKSSPFLSLLEETADQWNQLSDAGEEGIKGLLASFVKFGLNASVGTGPEFYEATDSDFVYPLPEEKSLTIAPTRSATNIDANSAILRLYEKIKVFEDAGFTPKKKIDEAALTEEIGHGRWDTAKYVANHLYKNLDQSHPRSLEMLANLAVCSYRVSESSFDVENCAAMFFLINSRPTAVAVRSLLPTKTTKGSLGEIASRFVGRIAANLYRCSDDINLNDKLGLMASKVDTHGQSRTLLELAFAPSEGSDSIVMRLLWEHFSGDNKQAEIRAQIMNLLWQASVPGGLACCLTYNPIDIPKRKSDALASIADQALVSGRFDLLQSFLDLRKTIPAKPFQIFVDCMLRRVPAQTEHAAVLSFVSKVETVEDGDTLRCIIRVTPRKIDCPDTITLSLSPQSPLRFEDFGLKTKIEGPFIEAADIPITFRVVNNNAEAFNLDVGCEAVSITGEHSTFTTNLLVDIASSSHFDRPSPDELDEAFSGFPEYQMRGDEYIERRNDERKIEKSLFEGKVVRSLWISSPRRSGKTSMLYRILDSFSHKAKRDNVIVYLTLDAVFENSVDFNAWVWKRLRTTVANEELRNLFPNFDELGKSLPRSADAGTFLGILADHLLKASSAPTRVIFLIDETDKLASMYFHGGGRRDAALEIMWQIRQLISERREVGFVFAGSSAAKRIFVQNSDAPFFNGITLLELSPFSAKTSDEEAASRAIVLPTRLSRSYILPKESLNHLLWICAGIPYYMKLVAGATFSVCKQSHILKSDVNDGLRALLSKTTGISKLDYMSGDPGSDELRTMAIESGRDRIITLAVLFAIAEAHSPVGGHRVLRSSVTSGVSPLVSRYRLSKKMIDRGLELAAELGLLRTSTDRVPEIYFSIPMLGESLRSASGRLWATIDHELEELANEESRV